jgi:hypothetical protein
MTVGFEEGGGEISSDIAAKLWEKAELLVKVIISYGK